MGFIHSFYDFFNQSMQLIYDSIVYQALRSSESYMAYIEHSHEQNIINKCNNVFISHWRVSNLLFLLLKICYEFDERNDSRDSSRFGVIKKSYNCTAG